MSNLPQEKENQVPTEGTVVATEIETGEEIEEEAATEAATEAEEAEIEAIDGGNSFRFNKNNIRKDFFLVVLQKN
jgi:hypothetical protein